MLIRLHGCADWSASLLFAYGINRFSHDEAQFINFAVFLPALLLRVILKVLTLLLLMSPSVELDRDSIARPTCSADSRVLDTISSNFTFKLPFLLEQTSFEPGHEIMALFILCKLILQMRMLSHPVGLDVWYPLSTSMLHVCEQWRLWRDCTDAQALLSLRWSPMWTVRMHRLSLAFAGRLCELYRSTGSP